MNVANRGGFNNAKRTLQNTLNIYIFLQHVMNIAKEYISNMHQKHVVKSQSS